MGSHARIVTQIVEFDDFAHQTYTEQQAEVAELADAHDSNSCGETLVGSSPTFGTGFGNGLLIKWQTVSISLPVIVLTEIIAKS